MEIKTGKKQVAVARIRRGKKCIYYLVNPHAERVRFQIHSKDLGSVEKYDPVTGKVSVLYLPAQEKVGGYESVIIMHPDR